MKHILVFLSFAFASLIFFNGCREEAKSPTDTHISGTIHVSVDESFAPIMRELGKIFQGNFPKAKIDMAFKSEAACLQDLFKDSTRMIFLARDLDSIEREMLKQKQIPITAHKAFARDAIAFITAKSNVPYQMSQRQLEDLCAGKLIGKQLVFDREGSSTYSYVADSILNGKASNAEISGANGPADVVKFVANNTDAIGVVGMSWLSDPKDSIAIDFLKKVQLVGIIPFGDSLERYRTPILAYIANGEYPYIRNLHFISKETHGGLGTGFVNWICDEGQLVIAKSNLFPIVNNVFLRTVDNRKKK